MAATDLGFATNTLDRSVLEREGEAEALLARPDRLVLAVSGDDIVLDTRRDATTALWSPADLPSAEPMMAIVLGLRGERPVTAVLYDAGSAGAPEEGDGVRLLDLRATAVQGVVPPEELGPLSQAKALFNWHRRHRFCPNCGHATDAVPTGTRRECAGCGTQHFPRTDPVAIMLITRGDRILLGRSGRFGAGMYSCLAGFVSPGETIEAAVRREVFEEAGIRVGPVRYLMSQPWPFPSSLMIGCEGEAVSDELTIDRTELEDARWFERREIEQMMDRTHPGGLSAPVPIAIANHLIRHWLGRS